MDNPGWQHWLAVKRILRYLKGTKKYALCYSRTSPDTFKLRVYSDADWVGEVDTRKSTSGYSFSLGSVAIMWCSKRQTTTALSSAEAEYISCTLAAKEVVWLRKHLSGVMLMQEEPTELLCDNQSAIALTKNPKFHGCTKHIEVQYHFVRGQVEEGTLKLIYCPTQEMVA
eukprot:c27606_g1_i3 orf=185-694(+)